MDLNNSGCIKSPIINRKIVHAPVFLFDLEKLSEY